jgi:hypothetical protein
VSVTVLLLPALNTVREKLVGRGELICPERLLVAASKVGPIVEAVTIVTSPPVAPLGSTISVVCPNFNPVEVRVEILMTKSGERRRDEKAVEITLARASALLEPADMFVLTGEDQRYMYTICNKLDLR